jgi:hypothetical protein
VLGLSLAVVTVQAAEAATLRLGPDCGPAIQDCVDAAADGDLILVPRKRGKGKPNDGYYENVDVNKDVTIRGVPGPRSNNCLDPRRAVDDRGVLRANAQAVIVGAAPAGDPGEHGFEIVAGGAGATIECFLIRHGQNAVNSGEDNVTVSRVVAIGQNDHAMTMPANGQRVLDSLVIGAGNEGIRIIAGDGAEVRGTWVRGTESGACFRVDGDNVRLTDNHARRCSSIAGFIISGDEPKLRGNTADSTGGFGFQVTCTGACSSGHLRNNTASNAHNAGAGDGFLISSVAGFEIRGNRAFKNMDRGFRLFTDDALVTDNIAERNGTGGVGTGSGFEVGGDGNTLLRNRAAFNKRDGFTVTPGSDGNTLGDGTDANRNRAIRNLMDGFDVESDGNTVDNNEATSNEGEGLENNGAGNSFTDNDSAGNRIDCAASVAPAVNTGNFCSDASDFGVPPQVERQGDGRR